MKLSYADIQNLQTNLLKNLMINSDGTEKRPSSRALFLKKFRLFIRDVVRVSRKKFRKLLVFYPFTTKQY